MLRFIPFLWSLMATKVTTRISRDRGATAVEYGLMVALIAVAIITAVTLIGTNLDTLFTDVAGYLERP